MKELEKQSRILVDPKGKYKGTLFDVRMLAFVCIVLHHRRGARWPVDGY
jgi:hypothetical protein